MGLSTSGSKARPVAVLTLLGLAFAVVVRVLSSTTLARADFVFNNGAEVQSLDPATVTGVPEGRILRGILEGLCVKDPFTLEPIPGAAKSWDLSKDRLTYTFHIREEARWSNGDPVTAHDFEFSFKRVLTPEVAADYSYLLWGVVGARAFCTGENAIGEKQEVEWRDVQIRAMDDMTLRIELEAPSPNFLEFMAFYPLYPVHRGKLIEAQERWPDTWQVEWIKPGRLVSNGPYVLSERRINDRIRMSRNEQYWDNENVALDTIDALPISHWGTSVNMYLTGEVDWLDGSIPPNLVPSLLKREDFIPKPYLASYFYRVNVTKPPLDDKRVRKALSLCIPRKDITEKVTKAGQMPVWSVIPWRDIDPANPPLTGADARAEARRLLTEAGYGEGGKEFPQLEIHFNTSETHKDVAEVIMDAWKRELGLDIKLKNQEWKVYLDTQKSLEYDVNRSSWIGDWVDPGELNFISLFVTDGANNKTGWGNAEFDALIERIWIEQDIELRTQLIGEAEALIMEELPILPIYSYVTQNLIKPRVGGFYSNMLNEHFPKFWYWMDDEELASYRSTLPQDLESVSPGGRSSGQYGANGKAAQIGRAN